MRFVVAAYVGIRPGLGLRVSIYTSRFPLRCFLLVFTASPFLRVVDHAPLRQRRNLGESNPILGKENEVSGLSVLRPLHLGNEQNAHADRMS